MKLVFTPDWFLGFDVGIELFSFIILSLLLFYTIRTYKLTKNKKALYLGIGFFLVALAELASILTKSILYYDTTITRQVGQMIITYHVVKSVDFLYEAGFFFEKLLTLFGFYIIYRFPLKKVATSDLVLTSLFIVISAFLGQFFYFVFHIITLVLLVLITTNFLKIYDKNKLKNTLILIWGFSLLTLSHIIFAFSKVKSAYVIAEIIQLISYLAFLIVIIMIAKKENAKPRKPK